MKSIAYATLLGAIVNIARAQIGADCYGAHYPNYDDCDAVIDFFGFRDNTDVVASQPDGEPSCVWWNWKDGNCRITQCWTVTNEYAGYTQEETGANLARVYDFLKGTCQKLKAGGQDNSAKDENGKSRSYTTVFNDPEQSPPSAKLRTRDGKPTPDRFSKETVTLEQHEAWVNRTQQRNSVRESGPRARDSSSKHASIMASKREDGDDYYYINNSGKEVRQEGVFDTGPRASNGVSTQYSTTNSKTFTSSTSTDIGGAFEFFTASVGFEFSESDSFSVTQGYTFTPNCEGNQQGQAFFYPFFDYYDVSFSPSGQRADVWLPVDDGDMFIKGEFEVQCLG